MTTTIHDTGALNAQYFDRMASSLGDKMRLIEELQKSAGDIAGLRVLEVGAGGGELTEVLSHMGAVVTVIDNHPDSVRRLDEKFKHDANVTSVEWNALNVRNLPGTFDAVICSSVIHEIFSYGNDDFTPYHPGSVPSFVEQVTHLLSDGGVLLIRDGIKPADSEVVNAVHLRKKESVDLLAQYMTMAPFVQSDLLQLEVVSDGNEGAFVGGNRQALMEAVYTITWGGVGLERESQELYGVYSLTEYCDLLQGNGFRVTDAYSYLQPGYPANLEPDIQLVGDAEWFDSNAIIVAEFMP